MGSFVKSEDTLREYLLGRVADETTLEGIEELLFSDEEFCSRVELMEDGIINDFVMGRLNEADAESFRATLAADPERRDRVAFTQALRAKALAMNTGAAKEKSSFFASIGAFFRQPMYAGASAVLVIAVTGLTAYFVWNNKPDNLAELQAIYHQARPTETRISEFNYAPLVRLRGKPDANEEKALRRLEISLIDASDRTPNEQTQHALGVFYLTQQKYGEAIREFESALKFANTNARIHNDLGVAHFELAKTGGKRLEELARGYEEFTKATELDPNLLEALFNKSLTLQELNMPREAKDSWNLYLQKDPSSPWADEARKNLARIETGQARFNKTDDQVLADFLTAYRNRETARVQQIHNDTKGLLRGSMVPLLLSRTFLEAKQRGDEAQAKESFEAMTYLGDLDQEQNGDAFVSELARFYARARPDRFDRLLQAKNAFSRGLSALEKNLFKPAIAEFESSRDLFAQAGNDEEASVAETWAAQLLIDVGEVAASRARLAKVIANAETRKFTILLPPAYYSLSIADYRQTRLSESAKNLKTALGLAETTNNTFETQRAVEALALNYADIGEFDTALSYAGRLLADRETYYESLGQARRDKGTLAFLSLKLKFFSTSLSLSREHLSITQERWPDTSRVNDSLRRMIDAAIGKDDFPAALKYAEQSLTIALGREPSPENTRITARVYLLLGDLKSRTKNCNEALTDYDKALELYSQFPEVTDSLYQTHKSKLFCFQRLARSKDFYGELQIVLKLAEKYRGNVREDNSRQAFFGNEQIVFDMATANALTQHDLHAAFEFSEAARARSLLEFVNSEKPIAEVEKDYSSIAKPLRLAEIQQRLPPQVQLVQYTLLPDKLAIWIVSQRRFDSLEKQITATALEEKVDAYQASIVNRAKPAEIRQAAQELYQLLIPSDLTRDQQLCLVPDKSLHQLAFATLVSPAGRYLLEDYALFYAPSASVLVVASENAKRKEQMQDERLLSIGNPQFDREENPNLPDLEDAESEARATAANYRKSQTLVGDEATKERFLRGFTGVEVVHFAGHFVANRQSPGNSKLLFAGGDLRSSELAAYKTPLVKLVVLSACQTFLERYNKSEGAIGAARTFLALGAPVVVASQWRVDSAPTRNLMAAFHDNRKQKRMTSAESLRQAQLELMSRNETSAPFYWAAFSLFGGYANY